MKKILIILALVAMASPSFAQTDINSTDGTSLGGGTFKPSKDVVVSFTSTTTAYAAGAKHKQGTKGYGATNIDPKLTEFSCAAGTTTVTITSESAFSQACTGS